MDRVTRWAGNPPGGERWDLGTVKLLAPIPRPPKIICIGLNYRDHAEESNLPIPETPTMFAKFPTSVIGAGQPIVLPKNSTRRILWIELLGALKLKSRLRFVAYITQRLANVTVKERAIRLKCRRSLQFATPFFRIALSDKTQAVAEPGVAECAVDRFCLFEGSLGLIDPVLRAKKEAAKRVGGRVARHQLQ